MCLGRALRSPIQPARGFPLQAVTWERARRITRRTSCVSDGPILSRWNGKIKAGVAASRKPHDCCLRCGRDTERGSFASGATLGGNTGNMNHPGCQYLRRGHPWSSAPSSVLLWTADWVVDRFLFPHPVAGPAAINNASHFTQTSRSMCRVVRPSVARLSGNNRFWPKLDGSPFPPWVPVVILRRSACPTEAFRGCSHCHAPAGTLRDTE